MDKTLKKWITVILYIAFITAIPLGIAKADPVGPAILSNTTDSVEAKTALLMNTSGGTITTVIFNGTSQDLSWKAYVGNVTGRLALQDSSNYSIFDWQLSSVTGEVYATRKSATVAWGSIDCAAIGNINTEQTALNIASGDADSIVNTFQNSTHEEFYTGSHRFTEDNCDYTTATYVNNNPQYADFQEILLYDGSFVVYSSLISAAATGYNNEKYDFQIILPEDTTVVGNTIYYFYVELS